MTHQEFPEKETRAEAHARQAPPGFLEETMQRIRLLPPPRYRWPARVWYATLYWLRQVASPLLTQLRLISIAWEPWVIQAMDALLEVLGPEERRLLKAHVHTHVRAPLLTRLPLILGGLVQYAPSEASQDWTPTLLTLFEKDIVPFLRAHLSTHPPTSLSLTLTPAQRDALVQRLRRRARRLRVPAAEQDRLEAAMRRYLLSEPHGEGGSHDGLG